jgi:putative nucleotidyltransferase with HDIG domain
MRQVTALALSSSVYNLTSDWNGAFDRLRFWRHSLEVAIAARMIAEQAGCSNAEDAFVAGLLHDLGLLILEKSFPEECQRVHHRARQGESLIDLEEETWNTNHARVGQFMLEQWNLPQPICTAVGHHHDVFPPDATNPDLMLTQVVALGNMLSRFSLRDDDHGHLVTEAESREIISANIALPPAKVADIQRQLFSKTMEEARYLEIEIGSPDELLQEANQMLFQQYLTVEELLRENRTLQRQLSQDRMKRMAGESLRDIAVSMNKHITNATGSLASQARAIQEAVMKDGLVGGHADMEASLQVIIDGIGTIGSVMKDLANLACLETEGIPDSASRASWISLEVAKSFVRQFPS